MTWCQGQKPKMYGTSIKNQRAFISRAFVNDKRNYLKSYVIGYTHERHLLHSIILTIVIDMLGV